MALNARQAGVASLFDLTLKRLLEEIAKPDCPAAVFRQAQDFIDKNGINLEALGSMDGPKLMDDPRSNLPFPERRLAIDE